MNQGKRPSDKQKFQKSNIFWKVLGIQTSWILLNVVNHPQKSQIPKRVGTLEYWIYAQCSCRLGQIGLRNGRALLMRMFICLLLFPDRKSSTLSCPPNSFVAFAFSVMNFEVIWKLLKWLLIYCESIWCGVESGLVATCLPKMLLVIIHAQPYNTNQKHSF